MSDDRAASSSPSSSPACLVAAALAPGRLRRPAQRGDQRRTGEDLSVARRLPPVASVVAVGKARSRDEAHALRRAGRSRRGLRAGKGRARSAPAGWRSRTRTPPSKVVIQLDFIRPFRQPQRHRVRARAARRHDRGAVDDARRCELRHEADGRLHRHRQDDRQGLRERPRQPEGGGGEVTRRRAPAASRDAPGDDGGGRPAARRRNSAARVGVVGWMPAIAHSRLPSAGLTRCQTSSNGSATPSASSRIRPWKRTLTTWRSASLRDVEHLGVDADDVGALRRAAALLQVELDRREHLGRRERAQVVQVAGCRWPPACG